MAKLTGTDTNVAAPRPAPGWTRWAQSAGSLLTDCGGVFASSRVLQLDRDPGERSPDPDQVCPACQRTQDAR